jgi:hypothetical protein
VAVLVTLICLFTWFLIATCFAPTPAHARAVLPTPTPKPVIPCGCAYDAYDCKDFANQETAQACFNYCATQHDAGLLLSDIHRLDTPFEYDYRLDGYVCEGETKSE